MRSCGAVRLSGPGRFWKSDEGVDVTHGAGDIRTAAEGLGVALIVLRERRLVWLDVMEADRDGLR